MAGGQVTTSAAGSVVQSLSIALIGIALFLTHLAKLKMSASALRASYPAYCMSKQKMELTPNVSLATIFDTLEQTFGTFPINKEDGLKIDFENEWVHLRTSNTEPIMRVYTEAKTQLVWSKPQSH